MITLHYDKFLLLAMLTIYFYGHEKSAIFFNDLNLDEVNIIKLGERAEHDQNQKRYIRSN